MKSKQDKEIEESMIETKAKFISNMDDRSIVRSRVFKQVYKMKKAGKELPDRMSWGAFKKEVTNDWKKFDAKDKDDFFNLWIGDVTAKGSIEDIKVIMGLIGIHGYRNLSEVFRQLKVYGREKKLKEEKKE